MFCLPRISIACWLTLLSEESSMIRQKVQYWCDLWKCWVKTYPAMAHPNTLERYDLRFRFLIMEVSSASDCFTDPIRMKRSACSYEKSLYLTTKNYVGNTEETL